MLAVAPHQDDEAIGCGGSLRLYGDEGAVTAVVFVSASMQGEQIGAEARAAADILGLRHLYGLGLPPVGGQFSTSALLELLRVVRDFRPHVLLAPHPNEDDSQHRTAAALTREATWLADYPMYQEYGAALQEAVAELYWYEVWTPLSQPTHFRDITSVVERKQAAIAAYRSQMDIAAYDEAVLGLNRYRGIMQGAGAYAEAFALAFSR